MVFKLVTINMQTKTGPIINNKEIIKLNDMKP